MRLLRQPGFGLLFAGSALNAIGTWATLIALWGFATAHFHVSPDKVALLGLAWAAPGALISPFAGVPIDRLGPRRVLLAANVLGVLTAVAMAVTDSFSTLVILALGTGTVLAFGRPAAMSLPPRLVEEGDLLLANSLLGVAEQSAIVFGPLVGSVAIGLWGIRSAFVFDAVTFVVGAVVLLPLALHPVTPAERTSICRELADGLHLARKSVTIRRTLALAGAVFLSWGAFFVMEPLYVRDVLHRSPSVLGLLQTAFGVGLIVTTAALPRIGDRVASVWVLAASVAVSGVAAALYVGTHSLPIAFVAVFGWGVDVAFFMPPMQTLLQRTVPVEMHGRVLTLASTMNSVGNLIAIPLAGVAVGAFGVARTGATVGALAVLAGAWGLVAERHGRSRLLPGGASPSPYARHR